MTNNAKNCFKTVFEQEISNQEANLIRMDVEVEAVESDDAEDSDFSDSDSNSELEEELFKELLKVLHLEDKTA